MKPHDWLLKDKQRFRHQVYGAICTSGQNLFELEYYRSKCNWKNEDKVLLCQDVYDQDFNIESEIKYFQEYEQVKKIEIMIIINCTIEYFHKNSFKSLEVQKILLHNLYNLQGIHQNAFGNATKVLRISGSNKLKPIVDDDYNLWSLITMLPLLESVQLSLGSFFINIPKLELTQTSLQSLVFDKADYKISNIESFAFSVSCFMERIVFRGVSIYKVNNHAFTTATSQSCLSCLTIDMSQCNVNEHTLAAQAFSTLHRPLCLNISKLFLFLLT